MHLHKLVKNKISSFILFFMMIITEQKSTGFQEMLNQYIVMSIISIFGYNTDKHSWQDRLDNPQKIRFCMIEKWG